jgi:arylamine N-acetyltransferase
MSNDARLTYTNKQLEEYFDRIALPKSKRVLNVAKLNNEQTLSYLKILLKHQLVRIPFENLTQHYSWHGVIDVNPLHVFRKVINQPGRGGYCMEANWLFHNVLYSLGFDCYVAAGRVWTPPAKKWTGWTHLVNLVTIGGTKYLCDCGFGPNEPIVPVALQHGEVQTQISPAETRLVFDALPEYLSDCKLWICQFRVDAESEWTPIYCFSEMELLPTDIPAMNYSPWLSRKIIFTQKVICVRFTTERERGEDGLPGEENIDGGEIDGTLVIDHDKLKWRRHGNSVLDVEFKSENDRVKALERYWGIELDVEDREAIFGTMAAVTSGT